ncbi:MAG: nuclear transport factor 2 family protein [Flavobacteriaceae bacterium]|nr:nuclear transport factor 2 family protein [Flavobacteriaceae bacterium]
MKKIFFFLFATSITFAQTNTEVFLYTLSNTNGNFKITNGKNISNNPGYDSQPHFYSKKAIVFSSTRNKLTDIAKYTIETGKIEFLNDTPNGGEYSPQRIPKSKDVSAVRLDNDGLQRFYKYDAKTGDSKEIVADLKVAYPMWYTKNTLIAVSIVGDDLDLVISELSSKKNTTIQKKTGRSLHHIPNSNLISYISKASDKWEIRSLDPKTGITKKIVNTVGKKEDICWLPDGTILTAYNNMLLKFNPKKDENWSIFHTFLSDEINNISRIIVNNEGTKLALVAEESPKHIVQKQVEAYNNRDIDAFLATYTKGVKVYTFPNTLNYEGREEMRKRYAPMFQKTKDLHCKIIKRIVNGAKVIDEELVTSNGNQFKAVAIYQVTNGKISSVTFLK